MPYFRGCRMEITWLGHASFMIKVDDTIIYTDPYSGEYSIKADIILISHEHYDHFAKDKISSIRVDTTKMFGPRKVSSELDGITSLNPGDERAVNGITIKAVSAYNTGKPFHPKGSGIGFVIETKNKSIYFAGDTDLIPEMKQIKADITLLPVGGTYTMNAEEAAEAAGVIKPSLAVPMHYGSVAGSVSDAEEFVRLCQERGIKAKILEKEWRIYKDDPLFKTVKWEICLLTLHILY